MNLQEKLSELTQICESRIAEIPVQKKALEDEYQQCVAILKGINPTTSKIPVVYNTGSTKSTIVITNTKTPTKRDSRNKMVKATKKVLEKGGLMTAAQIASQLHDEFQVKGAKQRTMFMRNLTALLYVHATGKMGARIYFERVQFPIGNRPVWHYSIK